MQLFLPWSFIRSELLFTLKINHLEAYSLVGTEYVIEKGKTEGKEN
jgi:hypothetical protein